MRQTWTVRALADLFAVANHVFGLSVVHLLRPAPLHMIHCFCGKYYSCSDHLDQDANWPQALSEQAADHLTVASTQSLHGRVGSLHLQKSICSSASCEAERERTSCSDISGTT